MNKLNTTILTHHFISDFYRCEKGTSYGTPLPPSIGIVGSVMVEEQTYRTMTLNAHNHIGERLCEREYD